jgi:hypothetical protein
VDLSRPGKIVRRRYTTEKRNVAGAIKIKLKGRRIEDAHGGEAFSLRFA